MRHPSQGIRHIDVSSSEFVAEHKYRKFSDYSAEFRHAIEQFDHNKQCHPDRYPLLLFTFFLGKGKANRKFMMVEVDDEKNIEELCGKLHELARKSVEFKMVRPNHREKKQDSSEGEAVA